MVWQELPRNGWVQLIRGALAAGRDLPEPPPGAPGPFSMGDADRTRAMLTAAGFSDVAFAEVDEPLVFGKDADDAFGFMTQTGVSQGLIESIEDETVRQSARDRFRAMLKAHETPDGVFLPSRSWIITGRQA